MPLTSGVPQQIGGKWVGFTDFTEFALQGPGALPAGLTLRGNVFPNAPNSFAIVADGLVGRYLSMNGQDTSYWGISLDAFDDLADYGEMVARVWIPTNTGNRRVLGPGFMSADAPAQWDFCGGHIFKRTTVDFESENGLVQNGVSLSGSGIGDMKFAEQSGVWCWVRWQKFRGNVPTTNDGMLCKIWYGEYADEPGLGWDSVNGSIQNVVAAGQHKMGWGCNAVFEAAEQRIAFWSFSEDPSVNVVPPPGGFPAPPGTPNAPVVTIDPLQDRWAGLKGSAYVVP